MKILVTGGVGNIGVWVTRLFLELGHEVHVLSRKNRDIKDVKGYHHINCDITFLDECKAKLEGKKFEIVIHLASMSGRNGDNVETESLMVNSLGTYNLIEAVNWKGLKRFIYLSTFHIYGRKEGLVGETLMPWPLNHYALTHLFAEEYIRKYHRTIDLPFVIFRLTNAYGCPFELAGEHWSLVVNDLAKMAFTGQVVRLKGSGSAQRDFIWMGDVVGAIQAAAESTEDFNDTYNLSSGNCIQLGDLVNRVVDVYESYSGKRLETKVTSGEENLRLLKVCNTRLKSKIAWEPSDRLESELFKIFKLLESGEEEEI